MAVLHHPEREAIQLASVLYALSDPVRLKIAVEIYNHGEKSCGCFHTSVAKSTLSHHMRILREAGIVHTRPQGTMRLISLRSQDLQERFPGLLDSIVKAYVQEEK
ncbi:transcriptional regulator [Paenibacillus oryzae]|jgi:DNA-binding transcriptional ArsR family regulator|uniref:Transcriptional regulator n=1 Tax=Paenibacillus oryzae TaxID=1844972 RepID=A0A1A5YQS6_9BACL|nr:helix-turn-helix transcriptional regulator [Paenibacillus oryzae]OBR67928.1 transcriptional regulator [Paenibacillus oryzae]